MRDEKKQRNGQTTLAAMNIYSVEYSLCSLCLNFDGP